MLDAFPVWLGQITALKQVEQGQLLFAQAFLDSAALLGIQTVRQVDQLGERVLDRRPVLVLVVKIQFSLHHSWAVDFSFMYCYYINESGESN